MPDHPARPSDQRAGQRAGQPAGQPAAGGPTKAFYIVVLHINKSNRPASPAIIDAADEVLAPNPSPNPNRPASPGITDAADEVLAPNPSPNPNRPASPGITDAADEALASFIG